MGRRRIRDASSGSLNDPFSFFLHRILGELDDQDRILGRQTDRGQESDLEVNVIIQRSGDNSAPMTPNGTTNMTEGGSIALIQRRQTQEDDDRDGIERRHWLPESRSSKTSRSSHNRYSAVYWPTFPSAPWLPGTFAGGTGSP